MTTTPPKLPATVEELAAALNKMAYEIEVNLWGVADVNQRLWEMAVLERAAALLCPDCPDPYH